MTDTDIKYTAEHEWIQVEGDTATIGITPFAQDALGDLVYVELPEVGRQLEKGDEFAVVESVKTAAEVYSPINGEIVGINDNLSDDPELIKKSLEEGWIVKIKFDDSEQLAALMDKDSYDKFVAEQN